MPAIPSANLISVPTHLVSRDATPESKIPLAAMIGGLAGGAILAILCTACWLLWTRAMRLSKERRKREAATQNRTESNTHYNTSALAHPWTGGYRPMLPRPAAAKVKFTEKPMLSGPKPLRSAKAANGEQQPDVPARVPRLPSTVSSVSLYSAESAEEHQIRAPTSLILAALGSVEAALTRGSWGDRRPPQYRGSQATSGSGSGYSQDVQVGVAY
ncbi:hypothetical protein DFH07DRAFT_305912 [Mycena maculata]|uniref:Uncharacterized protein n=1 Tax=Mycena maculata TaxID=230809 RepID=A0AAD7HHQ6_9AGAR|nr:hypothetical protein DFH07DRAFT_305912 [Mycena maculata]